MRRLLLCFLPLLLASCAVGRFTKNEPLDVLAFRALTPGTTTAREVVETLGAPTDVVQLGKRSAYRYDASNEKIAILFLVIFNMANRDERTDRLWLFFDENDVLTHKAGTFTTHRTQYAATWEDVHEVEDSAVRDADRPGLGNGK